MWYKDVFNLCIEQTRTQCANSRNVRGTIDTAYMYNAVCVVSLEYIYVYRTIDHLYYTDRYMILIRL